MIVAAAGLFLSLVLVASAAAKLVDGSATRLALATYGFTRPRTARAAWGTVIVVELVLAVGLAAGWRPLAWAAAAVFGAFAAAQAAALARGLDGAPCACFGARGRLSARSLARSLLLAGVALAVALAPRPPLATEQWLGLGLGAALFGLAGLSVVVLALAREVGVLRMATSPQGALEVPNEGPVVGDHSPLSGLFEVPVSDRRLRLAVFSSEGCAMCQALRPVMAGFARNPRVALREFDEVADARAWALADVPGSPYAIAVDADGMVLAKGTFNSGAQLESVLATAERRRATRAAGREREGGHRRKPDGGVEGREGDSEREFAGHRPAAAAVTATGRPA